MYIGLLHALTHIPRRPSGSVSRVAIGFEGGIVDEGVGATERMITCYITLINVHTHTYTHSYQDSPLVECQGWPLAMEKT